MRPLVEIPEEDRQVLQAICTPGLANKDVQTRAKVILLAGEGYKNVEIAEKLQVGDDMVGRWVYRYLERTPGTDLLTLLKDKPQKGKNRKYSDAARAWLRAYAAEHPDLTATDLTDKVHQSCAEAGFPELSKIARTSIALILKAAES